MSTANEFMWSMRIYHDDCYQDGVVYHANYLKYFERARTEWLCSLGFEQEQLARDPGIIFTVHRVEVDFLRPVRFGQDVEVRSTVSSERDTRLIFDQRIVLGDAKLACKATVRCVCVDAKSHRPRAMPLSLVKELVNVD